MPVPFDGESFTFTNPDGTTVPVRGWGNQFSAVFETPNGYTVVKDPESGYYHYAVLSEDRTTLRPSGTRVGAAEPENLGLPLHVRAPRETMRGDARAAHDAGPARRWEVRREQRRARRASGETPEADAGPDAAGVVGDYLGLCILVQFPDVPGSISQAEVDDFCNKPGYSGFGNSGSVHDYFLEVSGDKLRYKNKVTAYYTAKRGRDYYTDPGISYGTRARELIVEALDFLKSGGFDFSSLSSDGAGFIYALNVFYAGPRVNNWSEGLWPHQWSLASPYSVSATKKFSDYQITDMGSQLTLRTFCHENGHMICSFPDLYDYGGESYGVGHYSLMCYGGSNTNPTHVDAYLKDVAGWSDGVTTLTPGLTVDVPAGSNHFLRHRKNATEYFILENRQQTGRDAALPDAGLAIWHVDETGSNSNEQMTPAQHYEVSLEQADNRFDLERRVNAGDSEDLYGGSAAPVFGAGTSPNSSWWDGGASGLEIEEITAPGVTVTVRTKGEGGDMSSVVGVWSVVAVDWGCDGSVAKAGPFTFKADGTWKYASGGGRWVQVGNKVAWNFSSAAAASLVYTADVSAIAMSGIMGFLKPGGSKGCFYALRSPSPAAVEAFASALGDLVASHGATDAASPPGEATDPVLGPA